jgi:hypothetical protein
MTLAAKPSIHNTFRKINHAICAGLKDHHVTWVVWLDGKQELLGRCLCETHRYYINDNKVGYGRTVHY